MRKILGRKIGMTNYFDENGRFVPVTVIEAGPNVVTQVKTEDKEGYSAVQVGFGDRKEKATTKAMMGHFKKAGVAPMSKLMEIRDFDLECNVGDTIQADIFDEGEKVAVSGISKGKGFQGVVKRHGFRGVGDATHGQHNRMRAPGAIGACSYPARVFKGMRMAGRTGGNTVKTKNLRVEKILTERNLMLVKGNVPGANGSYVIVEK